LFNSASVKKSMKISVTKDQWSFALLFTILYLSWNIFVIGLKADHIFVALIIGLGSIISLRFFKFCLGFSAFLIFLILYDGLQIYPNYLVNPVSIQELYDIELSLFGFEYHGKRIIPNEYFLDNLNDIASLLLGFAYLMWMPGPLIFCGLLYIKNRPLLLRYSYSFLFVNIIGFIGYYLYPAAPPWYYFEYGTTLTTNINGDPGLLTEFDRLVGAPIFDTIYNRGTNVFAAVPSLHSAFPLMSLFYAIVWKHRPSIIAFTLLSIATWIAAVYSQHHYIIDVILGIMTAGFAFFLYEILNFKKIFSPLVNRIERSITQPKGNELIK